MEHARAHIAFVGPRRLVHGPLREVLPVLKTRYEKDAGETLLVFEVETGKQVDFDLRGTLAEVLERADASGEGGPRGPGRPKLGVVGREISLLPRHWDWLEAQTQGASGALRRLVEQALKHQPGKQRAARVRAALAKILSVLAGDRPHYEEATRALFAADVARFESLIAKWPKDIHAYALEKLHEAARDDLVLEPGATIAELHRVVWSEGDFRAVERLVAPAYVIHSDPGDLWNGKTLDRKQYVERVRHSRKAFPDLVFHDDELIVAGTRVVARWHAEGTQKGPLPGLPATGKRLHFAGQTIYEVKDGWVAGHWQVVDRLGFLDQVR